MKAFLNQAAFPLFWIGYAAVVEFTMGLRSEHIIFVAVMLMAFFVHRKTRALALAVFPYAVFGIVYDSLRLIPLHWRGDIQIRAPYEMESALLQKLGLPAGFMLGDFFQSHHVLIMDLIAACTYSLHVVAPIGFAFWLWLKKSENFSGFTGAFITMNVAAFATYILYPAAPPWYVTQHGFESLGWALIGNPAGLTHVDQWLGVPYFATTYARNSWNYGAIPSMHAAYPLLVSLFARRSIGRFRWFFYGLTALVAFSAVYLNHHYVIDLLLGWIYALISYAVFAVLPQRLRSEKSLTAPEGLPDSLEGSAD